MRWSKVKQMVEERFAPFARGRVHVHATRHRKAAECITRGWITLDGEEIFEASTKRQRLEEMKRLSGEVEGPDLEVGGWEFAQNLRDYLNMKPAAALASKSPVLQALAVLDTRTGKRTLAKIHPSSVHPMVGRLLTVRIDEEKGPA